MWPYVQINNLNQMQGPVTEVERHLLFIGSAASNTGKLLSLNTQSDFDTLLGEGDSELKTNLLASRDNAGQNWTAAAYVLPEDGDWLAAVRTAQQTQSFEGVVVLGQEWDQASINAAHALKGAVSNFCANRAQASALLLERLGREKRMDDAPAALAALHRELAALREAFAQAA